MHPYDHIELLMLCTKGHRIFRAAGKGYEIMNVVAEAHMITVILVLVLPHPHERLLHYHPYLVLGIYEAYHLLNKLATALPLEKKKNK
ncbi:hypothetical protein SETIT_9G147100v2 [Setaria italica]|uniref:Uncharacterized protein n=2 Tax=Setaria TaxID=4554 RepID=A0A368SID8_SETIT|nr:hypothetical protein SETIT_9G147100v2 [Setaria italica]TKV92161.1 hypothetical protein SEVIR_9G145700v2 [Setaria viridis]